jgi:hypothetical protein
MAFAVGSCISSARMRISSLRPLQRAKLLSKFDGTPRPQSHKAEREKTDPRGGLVDPAACLPVAKNPALAAQSPLRLLNNIHAAMIARVLPPRKRLYSPLLAMLSLCLVQQG